MGKEEEKRGAKTRTSERARATGEPLHMHPLVQSVPIRLSANIHRSPELLQSDEQRYFKPWLTSPQPPPPTSSKAAHTSRHRMHRLERDRLCVPKARHTARGQIPLRERIEECKTMQTSPLCSRASGMVPAQSCVSAPYWTGCCRNASV